MQRKRITRLLLVSLFVFTTLLLLPAAGSANEDLVTVCHKPGPNEVTIEIAASAVDAHEAHGDTTGFPCGTVFAECIAVENGGVWTHTDASAVYVLDVGPEVWWSTGVFTVGRADESLRVDITSLETGGTWSFTEPWCGFSNSRGGPYCAHDWYYYDDLGEVGSTFMIEITQAEEGLVQVECYD